MSNLVLKGDLTANFGEYLPTPYINRIYIGENSSGYATVEVELNVYLQMPEEADEDTFITQLESMKFYYVVIRFPIEGIEVEDVLSGKYSVRSLWAEYGWGLWLSTAADWADEREVSYDEEGNRILKLTYASQNFAGETLELGTNYWDNTSYSYYLFSFSTVEDLAEMTGTGDEHWATSAADDIPYSDRWGTFLTAETSEVSYEVITKEGVLALEDEIVYVDTSDAIYSGTVLQSITSQYYADSAATSDDIINTFQTLIDNYQDRGTSDSSLQNVLNSVSLILETAADAVDLLPQLNEYGKAFPSKTSATSIGQLYLEYTDKVALSNQALIGGAPLHKKSISGTSKITDNRGLGTPTGYNAPTAVNCIGDDNPASESARDTACSDGTYLGTGKLGGKLFVNRMAFPGTYSSEIDETTLGYATSLADDAWAANYGWVFFDYYAAMYNTLEILQNYNPSSLIAIFGEKALSSIFQLQEVKLIRYIDSVETASISQQYEYVEGVLTPLVGGLQWESMDTETEFPKHQLVSSDGGCTANSFIRLRNFDFPIEKKMINYGTTSVGSENAFNLMAFEFQDLMDYFGQLTADESEQKYVMEVTIKDDSDSLITQLTTDWDTYKAAFDIYNDLDPCDYDREGTFNQLFIDKQLELYMDDPASAPWISAPTVFAYYKELLEGTFAGNTDAMQAYAESQSINISPITGNKVNLDNFSNEFDSFMPAVLPEGFEHGGTLIFSCEFNLEDFEILQSEPETVGKSLCEFLVTD